MSKSGLAVSITLHVCLILALLYLLHHAVLYSLPQKKSAVLNAYVSHTPTLVQTAAHHQTPITVKLEQAPAKTNLANTTKMLTQNHTTTLPQQKMMSQSNLASTNKATTLSPNAMQQLLIFIAKTIQAHLVYPEMAQTHLEQGETLLQFELTPQGELQAITVIQSSGDDRLDEAAIQAVQASSPIAIPQQIQISQSLQLRLPVEFNVLH